MTAFMCILTSEYPDGFVNCDGCCETHCGEPGCHSSHHCWDCLMEDVYQYTTHGKQDRCPEHTKENK